MECGETDIVLTLPAAMLSPSMVGSDFKFVDDPSCVGTGAAGADIVLNTTLDGCETTMQVIDLVLKHLSVHSVRDGFCN